MEAPYDEAVIRGRRKETAPNWLTEIQTEFFENWLAPPRVVIAPTRRVINNKRLEALYDYWSACPHIDGAALMPRIDPAKMIPALGVVMILEPLDGGEDFLYRLYGSEIAGRLGRDLTGCKTSEIDTAAAIPKFFMRGYRAVMETRSPLLTHHTPPQWVTVSSWRRLILPVTRDESGEITRLLVGNVPGPWRPAIDIESYGHAKRAEKTRSEAS